LVVLTGAGWLALLLDGVDAMWVHALLLVSLGGLVYRLHAKHQCREAAKETWWSVMVLSAIWIALLAADVMAGGWIYLLFAVAVGLGLFGIPEQTPARLPATDPTKSSERAES
jgi:hypothetical protein